MLRWVFPPRCSFDVNLNHCFLCFDALTFHQQLFFFFLQKPFVSVGFYMFLLRNCLAAVVSRDFSLGILIWWVSSGTANGRSCAHRQGDWFSIGLGFVRWVKKHGFHIFHYMVLCLFCFNCVAFTVKQCFHFLFEILNNQVPLMGIIATILSCLFQRLTLGDLSPWLGLH